jgi:integrase
MVLQCLLQKGLASTMKYVNFQRGRYVVRVTVPLELRGIIGKRELVAPLDADKRSAERAAHGVINGFLATIDDAQAKFTATRPTVTSAAKAHYQAELEADDRERAGAGSHAVADTQALFAPRRASLLRLVAAGQIDGDEAEALIGYAADDLATKGIAPALPRGDLLRALAEVQLDAFARFDERNKGVIVPGEPKSALLTAPEPPTPVAAQDRGTGSTLVDVLIAFHKERTAGARNLADKTMSEHKVAVRMFNEFMGSALPVRSITRTDILAYKGALLQTPNRYTARFRGLTLPQAIKANGKLEKPIPTLDPKTINLKWLSHLSSIFRWGANNGMVDVNPAAGIRVDEGKGYQEPTRVPFTQDDLKAIFSNELFKHPARYETPQWALLLALYTGARSSSEIARIRLADIYEEQGVSVINLSLASKNVRSKRIVPVHDALIRLGFLPYVDKLRRKGKERLFPDWEPEDKINRWFLRSYKPLVGINDSRKVFHSFRHTLKTALARYGVNRDVSDLITGHADQSVGGIYIGDAAVTMVQAMSDGINRIDFKLPIASLDHKSPYK